MEIKELTTPLTKPLGLLWLVYGLILMAYAVLNFLETKNAWIFGLIAVLVSQFLIFLFLKEAKFATLPNGIIRINFRNNLKLFQHYRAK